MMFFPTTNKFVSIKFIITFHSISNKKSIRIASENKSVFRREWRLKCLYWLPEIMENFVDKLVIGYLPSFLLRLARFSIIIWYFTTKWTLQFRVHKAHCSYHLHQRSVPILKFFEPPLVTIFNSRRINIMLSDAAHSNSIEILFTFSVALSHYVFPKCQFRYVIRWWFANVHAKSYCK